MILNHFKPARVYFNPKNAAHLASLRSFIETGRWGEIQFDAEPPFVNVPEYVLRKYAAHLLKVKDVAFRDNESRKEATSLLQRVKEQV
jgi:hypothetical protein